MKIKQWIVLYFVSLFLVASSAQQTPRPLPDSDSEQKPQRPLSIRYTLGIGELDRFEDVKFIYYPRPDFNKINLLSLTGIRSRLIIKAVTIQFGDIPTIYQDITLRGDLRPGETKELTLPQRPITSVTIRATTWSFWDSPGQVQVEVESF